MVACASCRNQASRGLNDLADNLENKGTKLIQCGVPLPRVPPEWIAFLARQLLPNAPRTMQLVLPYFGPIGTSVLVDPQTIIFDWDGWERFLSTTHDVQIATQTLRKVAQKLRETQKACCDKAVAKRLWSQDNPFTRKPHKTTIRRLS